MQILFTGAALRLLIVRHEQADNAKVFTVTVSYFLYFEYYAKILLLYIDIGHDI